MAKLFKELDQDIERAIQKDDTIALKATKMNSHLEKYSLKIVTEILKKINKESFIDMAYTIIKELAINGIKANQKRIFFEDENLNIFNPLEYDSGLIEFKKRISEQMSDDYGKRCLSRGIYVKIKISASLDGMLLEILNNTPVVEIEEQRMREKIKKAMSYNDIAEFYMDNMDDTEGAGLGIALIIILLRNNNIDPNLFRIYTKENETISRVEIPFSEDYIPIRNRT